MADAVPRGAVAGTPVRGQLSGSERGWLRRLAEFLADGPPLPQVCRFFVMHPSDAVTARGALIALCQPDGKFAFAAQFGLPGPTVAALLATHLHDGSAIAVAVRSATSLLVPPHAPEEGMPHVIAAPAGRRIGADTAWAFLPLVSTAGPFACLVLALQDTAAPDLAEDLEVVRYLVALQVAVEVAPSRHGVAGDANTPRHLGRGSENGHARADGGLTTRQQRVLHLLAQKRSNADIARLLDYSVSTVRLDTMAVYAHLGVRGRREAVEEARRRGLLSD